MTVDFTVTSDKPNSHTEIVFGDKIKLTLDTDENDVWKPIQLQLKDAPDVVPEIDENISGFDDSIQMNRFSALGQGVVFQTECKVESSTERENPRMSNSDRSASPETPVAREQRPETSSAAAQ